MATRTNKSLRWGWAGGFSPDQSPRHRSFSHSLDGLQSQRRYDETPCHHEPQLIASVGQPFLVNSTTDAGEIGVAFAIRSLRSA